MSKSILTRRLAAGVVAALLVPAASAVAADVTYSLENVVVTGTPGNPTTGTIDVAFSGPAGTTLGAYDLDFVADSEVTITGYTLVAPYDGASTSNFDDTFGGGEYAASAVYDSPFPTLSGGADVVGRFSFEVPADTFGTFDLTWVGDFTSGQEGSGTLYNLTLNNGSVTVNDIPEPATGLLLLGGGVAMLVSRRRGARA